MPASRAPLCAIGPPSARARDRALARTRGRSCGGGRPTTWPCAHVLVPSPQTAAPAAGLRRPAREADRRPAGVRRGSGWPPAADPPLILSVGIAQPRKGHDVLIDALSRLRDLAWQAEIVGRSATARMPDGLATAAEALDGRVAADRGGRRPDAARSIRAATLLRARDPLRGVWHGLRRGAAARSAHRVLRAGAVPDTVPANAGLLVPPDDPEAFADALRRVLTEPSLRERLRGGFGRGRPRASRLGGYRGNRRSSPRPTAGADPHLTRMTRFLSPRACPR